MSDIASLEDIVRLDAIKHKSCGILKFFVDNWLESCSLEEERRDATSSVVGEEGWGTG
jgi:hypothetical protein